MRILLAAVALWCLASAAAAAVDTGAASAIVLPADNDDYAKLVARAAAQDSGVDFRALRLAWLKSAARKRPGPDEDNLRKAVFAAATAHDDKAVRDAAIKLLSVDYIDLYGQKFLRQACKQLNDTPCAEQGHFVEFGLLDSITSGGDGKTCKTGWEVVTVKEEYFMVAMVGAHVTSQALVEGCDLLNTVDQDGKVGAYYFRIGAVLADEQSMFH